MDLDINRMMRAAIRSKNKYYKKFIYWFCRHYFYCDIHPTKNISETVEFAHNGLGVVINKDARIGENVLIQHHVTIGSNHRGIPHIRGGCNGWGLCHYYRKLRNWERCGDRRWCSGYKRCSGWSYSGGKSNADFGKGDGVII